MKRHPAVPHFLRALVLAILLALLVAPLASAQEGGTPENEPPQAETPAATAAGPSAESTSTIGATPAAPPESNAGTAVITAVDSSHFPDIHAYLMANDLRGERLDGLDSSNVTVFENGLPVSGVTVTEQAVGVQVVFVIDATEAFKARDIRAVTRLDYVQQALTAYAQGTDPALTAMRAGVDDVTVLAVERPVIVHSQNPGAVVSALSTYTTTFAGAADPFPLIHRALDFAAEVTPQPGMPRYVLYLSNGINRPDLAGALASVAERAAASQVMIYTMYVGPQGAENTIGSQNLLRLAEATGGQRLVFAGPESFAPFFELLEEQGRQYRLSYRSQLASTGQHTLAAQVTLADGALLSAAEVVFPLRIEPPVIALRGLPENLVRVSPAHDADTRLAQPEAYTVEAVIDFPDGHVRGVRQVQLVVDGEVAATQAATGTVATLTWPLAAYTEAASHQLQARVIDELGLAAESEVVTVVVSLQAPAAPAPGAELATAASANWPLLAVAGLGLALAVGVGAGAWYFGVRREQARLEAEAEPAAPVPAARAESPRRGRPHLALPHVPLPHLSMPALRWPSRAIAAQAQAHVAAYLEVIAAGAGSAGNGRVELPGGTITLGRDSELAEVVFDNRSVARRHARIVAEGPPENPEFKIYDEGSTAGTWVNYAPVVAETGCRLHDKDLIHLGRVQLRFRQPVIDGAGTVNVLPPELAALPTPSLLTATASNGNTDEES